MAGDTPQDRDDDLKALRDDVASLRRAVDRLADRSTIAEVAELIREQNGILRALQDRVARSELL